MNIQIFGKSKCFDTKKALRYFKERKIKVQEIDILDKGISKGELDSVMQVLGFDALLDTSATGAELVKYLAYRDDKIKKMYDNQMLIKTPIVRNGKKSTVGYCPEIWKEWEQEV